jgi:hypothetical protein
MKPAPQPFLTVPQLIAALSVSTGLYLYKNDTPVLAWGDALMFALLGLLLWWCFSTRGREPAGHEQANQGIAFRFGKALNRIRRGSGS